MPLTITITDAAGNYVRPSEQELTEIRASIGRQTWMEIYETLYQHRVERLAREAEAEKVEVVA